MSDMNVYRVLRRNGLCEEIQAHDCDLKRGFFVFSVFADAGEVEIVRLAADTVAEIRTKWAAVNLAPTPQFETAIP